MKIVEYSTGHQNYLVGRLNLALKDTVDLLLNSTEPRYFVTMMKYHWKKSKTSFKCHISLFTIFSQFSVSYNSNFCAPFLIQCSVSCGSGYQRRAIRCRLRDGQEVGPSACNSNEMPSDIQECHEPQCRESTTPILTTYPPTTSIHTYPPSSSSHRRLQTVWRIGSWTTVSI